MDSFSVTNEIPVDLKIKTAIQFSESWYLINVDNMMLMIATENTAPVNLPHDKLYAGTVYPLRVKSDGLHYFDQVMASWVKLEDNVQRHFSDHMADKELLGDG